MWLFHEFVTVYKFVNIYEFGILPNWIAFHNLFFTRFFLRNCSKQSAIFSDVTGNNLKIVKFFIHINWEWYLCNDVNDANLNEYLAEIDSLLNTHAPLKNLTRKNWNFLPNMDYTSSSKFFEKEKQDLHKK